MNVPTIKKWLHLVAHLLSAVGLVLMCLLPTDPYGWMSQMDASIPPNSIVNHSNSALVISLVVSIVFVLQLAVLLSAPTRRSRYFSAVILGAVVVTLAWRM